MQRSRLVDSNWESMFDDLVATAARLLDAPFAFVAVVDDERSFWKAAYGVADSTRANSVSDSFCQYVINTRDDVIVNDASANP